jgi:hypothetical protein
MIAATTGPAVFALMASATLCSVAPAATVTSATTLGSAADSMWIVPPETAEKL